MTHTLLGDRLGRYLVHSATQDTGALSDAALHRELAGLRERGIRVGISTSGPRQREAIRAALDVDMDGEPLFTAFQVTWNLLEPSVAPAAVEAAEAGAQVVIKESVANGRLVGRGEGARQAARVAGAVGVALDRLATAAALTQPWAWRVLSGAVTREQLCSHLAAADLDLDPAALAEALRGAEPAEAYWAARSARPWT